VNRIYIASEIPEVSFVLIVRTACGTKEAVVKIAAIMPIILNDTKCPSLYY